MLKHTVVTSHYYGIIKLLIFNHRLTYVVSYIVGNIT